MEGNFNACTTALWRKHSQSVVRKVCCPSLKDCCKRVMPNKGNHLNLCSSGLLPHTFFEPEMTIRCDLRSGEKAKQAKRCLTMRQGRVFCFNNSNVEYLADRKRSSISCTTFNILAPIYKRLNGEDCRESDFREFWLSRNERILEMLLSKRSSIICLQEFWLGNEELVTLYQQSLGTAGYEMFQLARTNNRGDGLFTAIKKDELLVLDYRQLLFHDCGDRVAQILRLQYLAPKEKADQSACSLQEVILVNTHLLFPHNSNYSLVRLRQVYKILEYLKAYKAKHQLSSSPVLLCGDWNGSKRGQVYNFLRSQGFVSSYDLVHNYTDGDKGSNHWVSHRNHRGNICGVDFIWLLNPTKEKPPLMASWKNAVFGIVKYKLHKAGLKERDAFGFFKAEDKIQENVNFQDFYKALKELGLTDEEIEGLTKEEVKDLMLTADIDGNGVIDYDEFKVALCIESPEQKPGGAQQFMASSQEDVSPVIPGLHSSTPAHNFWNGAINKDNPESLPSSDTSFKEEDSDDAHGPLNMTVSESLDNGSWLLGEFVARLNVMDAFLYPPEVEEGEWPDDYFLSDHAPLTAIFSPICSAQKSAP